MSRIEQELIEPGQTFSNKFEERVTGVAKTVFALGFELLVTSEVYVDGKLQAIDAYTGVGTTNLTLVIQAEIGTDVIVTS